MGCKKHGNSSLVVQLKVIGIRVVLLSFVVRKASFSLFQHSPARHLPFPMLIIPFLHDTTTSGQSGCTPALPDIKGMKSRKRESTKTDIRIMEKSFSRGKALMKKETSRPYKSLFGDEIGKEKLFFFSALDSKTCIIYCLFTHLPLAFCHSLSYNLTLKTALCVSLRS